jgi:hypothetical protein
MSTVYDLLDRLSEIGATIRPAGDHLILRAGSRPVPAELVKRIHEAKADVLAVLLPEPSSEARRWQERFTVLTFAWGAGKRDWEAARRLAWGDLQNEWHKKHGRRWPVWQCAGCERPIGGLEAIDLPDNSRVHFEPIDCMLNYGVRWRGDAQKALLALGLRPPNCDGSEP